MIRAVICAVILAVAQSASADEIYKCLDTTGRTIFSNIACKHGQKTIKKETVPNGPPPTMRGHGSLNSEEATHLIHMGQVQIGMSAKDARRSWGDPDTTNPTINASGRSEQWVYRRGNYKHQYLYFKNGILTTIQ